MENRDAIKQERLQNRLGPEVQEFRDSRHTLQLATINAQNIPHVSYAPFAFDDNGYYIMVSDLAIHGQNLSSCKNVSIMMVEDETEAKSVFARKRLTFDTQATLLDKASEEGQQGVDALVARLGDMADSLSKLGDFKLYRLTPSQGRYVKGFGKAFVVTSKEMLEFTHLNESNLGGHGHQQELPKV